MLKKIILCFLLVQYACLTFAQAKKDTISLPEVVLKGAPIQKSVQKTAAAVAILTAVDINKSDGLILTSVLNTIPGVNMQQGALNTNRIMIRGIGARAQFGTTKIKAYFDGIPLTTGEGETTIDDLNLSAIEKIEITKGPNATSFGSGLGGVIQLFSKETPAGENFAKAATTLGSFGLLHQQYTAGFANAKSNWYSSYANVQQDGFRANSDYNRKTFNLHGKQQLGTKGKLSFLGTFTRLKAFIPSSINENDFNNNPEKAAPTWASAKGFESYDKVLLGLAHQHQFTNKWSLQTSVFGSFKEAYEPRPFDILEDNTNTVGLRAHANFKNQLFSIPMELSFGTELLKERYNNTLYRNLYQSQPGQGSVQGEAFSTVNQNRNYSTFFVQMELQLNSKLQLETGLAFNETSYSLENEENQGDPYSFGAVWSPRVGLSYQVSKGKHLYTAVSNGFSVPSVSETLTPQGQINSSLKPELGWNYEVGFKGNWLGQKLYTEVALYTTQIKNLLVARRTAEDQFVGINAGSSSHSGLEFVLRYLVLNTQQVQVKTYTSGTLNNFKFNEFVDGDADYSGNQLTGAPQSQFNFGIDVQTKMGVSWNTALQTVGKIPMNDSNTKYSDRYALLDSKLTYLFTLFNCLKTEANAGVNNALNQKYAANILPNAVGFGTAAPRYFYPGNPINYYGGFSVAYYF
ncbi:TonB-dependent receptor family protein [Flavobacterium sp. GNP001]